MSRGLGDVYKRQLQFVHVWSLGTTVNEQLLCEQPAPVPHRFTHVPEQQGKPHALQLTNKNQTTNNINGNDEV